MPARQRSAGRDGFGSTGKERFGLNEESLWAGCPVESWATDYPKHLAEVRRLIFAGQHAKAQAYGIEHMTARPTSFRSYQPLADLWLDFGAGKEAADYRRELSLAEGLARVTYQQGGVTLTREAFVSAPDNVLAVRVSTDKPGRLAFTISLTRPSDAIVTAMGTIACTSTARSWTSRKRTAGPRTTGAARPGGKHMKFAGRRLVPCTGAGSRPTERSYVSKGPTRQ